MFVLIVKEDKDIITKCMHGIKTCLQSVRPHVTVQHRSLSDQSDERFRIKCDKVIFLVSNKSASVETAKTEWIAKLPKICNDNAKFKIIRLGATNERVKKESNEEPGEASKANAIKGSNNIAGKASKGKATKASKGNAGEASKAKDTEESIGSAGEASKAKDTEESIGSAGEASKAKAAKASDEKDGKASKAKAAKTSNDNAVEESKAKDMKASNDNAGEPSKSNATKASNENDGEASAKASEDNVPNASNNEDLTNNNIKEVSDANATEALNATAGNSKNIKNDSIISVASFESNVFQWWPEILVFLFGKTSVGRWLNRDVPSKNLYCLHYFPDSAHIAHPITRQLLNMLQTFGARKAGHSEEKQCCILLCKDAGMHLPLSQQSEFENSSKHVHTFAVALSGTNFSDDLISHTDRHFTKHSQMSLILVLLTELNLINAKTRHQPAGWQSSGMHIPSVLNFFIAHLVFTFNIPALLIQLAVAMVLPWPFMVLFAVHDSDKKVKYANLGFAVSSIAAIITVIVTECVLYPNFSPFPISVPVAIYLLIWQIGAGLKLHIERDYKYGIFSIPSQILSRK